MAEVWAAAVATVAVGVYTADQNKKAGEKAANAAEKGSNAEIAERQRQYDLTRSDQKPWLDAGTGALTQMQQLNSGDFSSFKESPDYQFALQQGFQGLDRSAAKRGSLYSGGHSADLMKYGQGMAAQQYGTFYSRLNDIATGGNATATGLGTLGMGMAGQNAASIHGATSARMSAYGNAAEQNSRMAASVAGGINNYYQQQSANNGGGTGWYMGNNPGKG